MEEKLEDLMGWRPPTPKQTEEVLKSLPFPVMSDIFPPIRGSGRGKIRILSDYMKILNGSHIGQVQATSDCVSFATAHCCDYVQAFEIVVQKQREAWLGVTSTEDLYGGSRVQIGKGKLGSGGGSIGGWVAEYITKYGTLLRKKYERDDLTTYSSKRADAWGLPNRGTPEYLMPIARKTPIRTTTLVTSYEEARDAIYNGYAVNVCSNQGFSSTRDKDGFLRPQGTWHHSMACIGVDDSYSRRGILIQNSWPYTWVSGPTRHDMPPGSFWVDADVINHMLKQQDSYAYSDKVGFELKKLDISKW